MSNNPTGASLNDINAATQTGSTRTIKTSTAMGVASSDETQTFGTLQSFSAGLSASALTIGGGATFLGNISAPNIVTSFNGATGAITYNGGAGSVNPSFVIAMAIVL